MPYIVIVESRAVIPLKLLLSMGDCKHICILIRSSLGQFIEYARLTLNFGLYSIRSICAIFQGYCVCANILYDFVYGFVQITNKPRHEISNNMVCATTKGSGQPAHTRSLIRVFASRLNML